MSNSSGMGNRTVAPSASSLVRQAARNLHTVEWLFGNDTWRPDWFFRRDFWRTRRMMTRTPDEAAAWLPALAFAVSCEKDADILAELARQPLPELLPPEALPWRAALIRSWERQRAATSWGKTVRLAALVRLDRRVERLPEWLAEARRAMDLEPKNRHPRLAALAGWRPRPGDGPPHGDKAEAAKAWVRFWEERYRTPGSELDGLIAPTALLHLADAGWLPSGPSPERLREEFRQRVQQVQPWTISYHDRSVPGMLLSSFPADASAPERLRQDITDWLELIRKGVDWRKREAVWGMLVAWQRESVLERGGIGRGRLQKLSLLPDLARTLEWERNDDVLLAMAGYTPGAAEISAHPEAARAVVAHWEALSRSDNGRIRQAVRVARWNFLRAGVLTAEEQTRFGADYVEAIGVENDPDVLLALAQTRPPGSFPLDDWKRRLSDRNNECRLAARLAIHGWLVEVAGGGQRRQVRQVLRRAGQKVTGTVAPFVNIPREVLPDFQRLHEIETALAVGQIPPPPDAGKGKRKRMGHLATLARLPETHPRTGPPGITGRTAGSESTTRHPFPEPVRHE